MVVWSLYWYNTCINEFVQSSFDNSSINAIFSCILQLYWFWKGILSLIEYGPVSILSSVTRLCKKFKSCVDPVKNVPQACLLKIASSPKMVWKVKNLIAIDARFTTRYIITNCVCISVVAAHTILRRDWKKRRKLHHLAKELKLARVKIFKQLFKQFS
jgi:hypothetical protein